MTEDEPRGPGRPRLTAANDPQRRVVVIVRAYVKDHLRILAAHERMSVSAYVRKLIDDALADAEFPPPPDKTA